MSRRYGELGWHSGPNKRPEIKESDFISGLLLGPPINHPESVLESLFSYWRRFRVRLLRPFYEIRTFVFKGRFDLPGLDSTLHLCLCVMGDSGWSSRETSTVLIWLVILVLRLIDL